MCVRKECYAPVAVCITHLRKHCCSSATASAWCLWSVVSRERSCGRSWPCGPAGSRRTAATKCLHGPHTAPQTTWATHITHINTTARDSWKRFLILVLAVFYFYFGELGFLIHNLVHVCDCGMSFFCFCRTTERRVSHVWLLFYCTKELRSYLGVLM